MPEILTRTCIMKIGLVIVAFNRPEYTRRCFESFSKASLPDNTTIILIDDNSTDAETIKLIKEFQIDGRAIIKYRHNENKKIYGCLKIGFDKCFDEGCSIVMNFDNDAIIKPHAITKLV